MLIADGTAWPVGDALTPLAGGPGGSRTWPWPELSASPSDEPGRLRPSALAPSDAREAAGAAACGGWLAFRRSDFIALGPLDERFVTPAWLDVWWSLRLRAGEDPDWTDSEADETATAEGAAAEPVAAEPVAAERPAAGAGAIAIEVPAPRRAVRLDLPVEHDEIAWPPDRSRLGRRNMYRVLDRWGWRQDLV